MNAVSCLSEGSKCNDEDTRRLQWYPARKLEESDGDGDNDDKENSSSRGILLFVAIVSTIISNLVIFLPYKYGDRQKVFVSLMINAEIIGWSFIAFLKIEVRESLRSRGIALAVTLLASAIYYVGIDVLRHVRTLKSRIGIESKALWESLMDFDQDIVSYTCGFVLYQLILETIIYKSTACSDTLDTKDDNKDEDDVDKGKCSQQLKNDFNLVIFGTLLGGALLLLVIEFSVKGASNRYLRVS